MPVLGTKIERELLVDKDLVCLHDKDHLAGDSPPRSVVADLVVALVVEDDVVQVIVVLVGHAQTGGEGVLEQDGRAEVLSGLATVFDGAERVLNLLDVDRGDDDASGVVATTRAGATFVVDVVVDAVPALQRLELVPNDGFTSLPVAEPDVLVDRTQFSTGMDSHQ